MHYITTLASLLALGSTSQAVNLWEIYDNPTCIGTGFIQQLTSDLWLPKMDYCHNEALPFKSFTFSDSNSQDVTLEAIDLSSQICDLTIYSQTNCFEPQKLYTYEDINFSDYGTCFKVARKLANSAYGTAKSSQLKCRPRHAVKHKTALIPVTTVPETTIAASTMYSTVEIESTVARSSSTAVETETVIIVHDAEYTTTTNIETVMMEPQTSFTTIVYITDGGYGPSPTTSRMAVTAKAKLPLATGTM